MRAAGQISAAAATRPNRIEATPFRQLLVRRGLPYALIAPAVLVIAGVLGYPLAMLLWLSTQHYGLRELFQHQGEFVGLANFATILGDSEFRHVVLISGVFTVVNVGLSMLIATGIAL